MALVASGGMNKSSFGDLLEPGFRKIFFEELQQLPTMYDKIFHVMDSNRQQEYDSSVSGLGQLVASSAAQPVTYESLLQGKIRKIVALFKFRLINGENLKETLCFP